LWNNTNKYAKDITFKDNTKLLGIFYLGGIEQDYIYDLVYKYYSKDDINKFENIELGGEECYLIVPRYNIKVSVYKLSMNEDGGTDKELVKTVKEPFFLKCNISDIFPNSEILFEHKGKEYTYSPYISLKDGSVVTEEFVYLVEE
jgi:hypothetical protein